MKKTKRLLSLAIATLTAVGLSAVTAISSFAADTYSVTVNDTKAGHTYEAYQIFTGKLNEAETTLSDIEWGTGVDGAALLTELKTITAYADCESAADVAEALDNASTSVVDEFAAVVAKHLATASKSVASSDGKTVIDGLSVGYYLIKDAAAVSGTDAATKFIVELVKDVEVTPKSSVPDVVKKVQDNDDGVADKWQDVADYSIGDKVPFQITGTMPSTIADYSEYIYIFHDTLSKGLTFNNDVVVKIGDVVITPTAVTNTTTADKNTEITISFDDILAAAKAANVTVDANTKVVVTYTATVNSDAIVGLDGNPNEVYLEFSNNPNADGKGETGETPKDQVVVFTYKLEVTKVDGQNATKKLQGAQFTLKNADGKFAKIDANNKLVGWVDEADASTLTSDENGFFTVIGLDEGTYTLTEIVAPDGYNLLANPITLVITANDIHDVDYTGANAADLLTAITLKVDSAAEVSGDAAQGLVSTNVENNSGSVLPSTGGIGTTLFFVGGGIIVAAAVIILIARKRMKNAA